MRHALRQSSIILVGLAALGVLMFVPAAISSFEGQHHEARSFFYGGITFLVLTGFMIFALGARRKDVSAKLPLRQLVELIAAFAILPLFLAVPLQEALQNTRFINAYFEMLSALSGSGATVFGAEGRLSGAIALWRAMVAWLGVVMYLSAVASVFLPLNIAGYELREQDTLTKQAYFAEANITLVDVFLKIVPLYFLASFAVWGVFLVMGASPLIAAFHALTLMSLCGFEWTGASGLDRPLVEIFCAVIMLMVLSQRLLGPRINQSRSKNPWRDVEIRLLLFLCGTLALIATVFHLYWGQVFGNRAQVIEVLRLFWGQFYTMVSFAATFGDISVAWEAGAQLSGLETANMILIALAVIGGSAASAAGGIKLIRIFVLWMGVRDELERMPLPSLVPRQSLRRIGLSAQAPELAWVFFMIFVLAFAGVSLGFGALGLSFQSAILFAASALSTTGPLLTLSTEGMAGFATSTDAIKLLYMAALFAGRFELLAFLVLFSPALWRR